VLLKYPSLACFAALDQLVAAITTAISHRLRTLVSLMHW